MCLTINNSTKAKKPNKDGYCIGWKVMLKNNAAIFEDFRYKEGENVSNRQEKTYGQLPQAKA